MSTITNLSREDIAERLGLSDFLESSTYSSSPSPWGVARLIRREVRRKGLVTRRDLRKAIEPYFSAAGFIENASEAIVTVADRMVRVGELADLKVENQRGYAAIPSRWIRLGKNDAVLLGTTATETHRFASFHPNQFLRRFRPNESVVSDLANIGVNEQPFSDWLGQPGWQTLVECPDPPDTLNDLLRHFEAELDLRGQPVGIQMTNMMAIAGQPGTYFGRSRIPSGGRWTAPKELPEGMYVAAIPGRNENHWLPALLKIDSSDAKSLDLNVRNNQAATFDLRNWLLVALGAARSNQEAIRVDREGSQMQITFPAPSGLQRILELLGEPSSKWQIYDIQDLELAERLFSEACPLLRFA